MTNENKFWAELIFHSVPRLLLSNALWRAQLAIIFKGSKENRDGAKLEAKQTLGKIESPLGGVCFIGHACSVLLTWCRGYFIQHCIDETTNILHCYIEFAYPSREEWEQINRRRELKPSVDKGIEFCLKDGRRLKLRFVAWTKKVKITFTSHEL